MRLGNLQLPDGRTLAYGDHGSPDGHPIVFNHPLPGGRTFSLDPAVMHANGARVISVERPGIGSSTRSPGRTLTDWPADVLVLADALGLDEFAVVGMSTGSSHALAIAHGAPDRVTRLGLVCAVGPILDHPEFDDVFESPLKALLPFARQDLATAEDLLRQVLAPDGQRYRDDPEAFFDSWVLTWPSDQQQLYRDAAARWMPALEAVYQDTAGFADDIIAGLQWNFDLAEIGVPVRAWHGTADKTAPIALTRLVVEQTRGDMIEYAGIGHYLGTDWQAEGVRWLLGHE